MNAEVTRTKTAVVVMLDHIEVHLDRENALRLAAQLAAAAKGLEAREVEGDVVPEVRVSGFVRTVGT